MEISTWHRLAAVDCFQDVLSEVVGSSKVFEPWDIADCRGENKTDQLRSTTDHKMTIIYNYCSRLPLVVWLYTLPPHHAALTCRASYLGTPQFPGRIIFQILPSRWGTGGIRRHRLYIVHIKFPATWCIIIYGGIGLRSAYSLGWWLLNIFRRETEDQTSSSHADLRQHSFGVFLNHYEIAGFTLWHSLTLKNTFKSLSFEERLHSMCAGECQGHLKTVGTCM